MRWFYVIEPEVPGGLGERTILDRSVHPPLISRLHYQFDGWLGDQIVTSFPAFMVTGDLATKIQRAGLTGVELADVEISVSPEFEDLHPGATLPPFRWLKPIGVAGRDDFGLGRDHRLVVSKKTLDLIAATKPRALDVRPYEADFVSLWVGVARSEDALRACVTSSFSEDDFLGSPFSRAFGLGRYEEALLEAVWRDTPTSRVDELLRGASYEDVIIKRFQAAGTLDDPASCAVLLYDRRHYGRDEWATPDVAFSFFGSVK
jgi:hypothetical protein